MALMFQRIARNFAKNGYFPTDANTLSRIISMLSPVSNKVNIIDPCCGEGTALAEIKAHLGADNVKAFGVEINQERAEEATQLLDECIQGDLTDCIISPYSFGLMFLNPPYGDYIRNGMSGSERRLEEVFFKRSVGLLQQNGVMVFIIPHYVINKHFANLICRHLDNLVYYLAPEQRFKQMVFIGTKRRTAEANNLAKTVNTLLNKIEQQKLEVLPKAWAGEKYTIPTATEKSVQYKIVKINPDVLSHSLECKNTLWHQFQAKFVKVNSDSKRPLMNLSDWHLALALTAGQISGLVESSGKRLLVKGSTYKAKKSQTEIVEKGEDIVIKTTMTDHFIPIIKAIDLNNQSQTFGKVLTIK